MTKEEKEKQAELDAKAEEKAQDDESTEEEEEETDSEDEDESDEENNDNEIDYKAIAEAEKEKRKKAELALAKKRFNASRHKRDLEDEDEEDEDEDEEDKPITKKDLLKFGQDIERRTTQTLLAGQIKKIAISMSESTDEAEAIIATHSNRSFPSDMPLEEQLEECYAIVNRKKLLSKNKELSRALKNKDKANKDSTTTYKDSSNTGNLPKINSQLLASFKRAGFEYDQKRKIFRKKTGKVYLCKDPLNPSKSWQEPAK